MYTHKTKCIQPVDLIAQIAQIRQQSIDGLTVSKLVQTCNAGAVFILVLTCPSLLHRTFKTH